MLQNALAKMCLSSRNLVILYMERGHYDSGKSNFSVICDSVYFICNQYFSKISN